MVQSIKRSGRCTATKKAGGRCLLITCTTGPYCWIHTRTEMNLRVKPSKIKNAGLGLYVDKPGVKKGKVVIKKNHKVCDYTGPIKTKNQIEKKYPGNKLAKYAIPIHNGYYIDPIYTNSGVGRYANDANNNTRYNNNAKFNSYPKEGRVEIKAKKNIKQGQEVYADYGPSYWKKRDKKKLRTTRNSNNKRKRT